MAAEHLSDIGRHLRRAAGLPDAEPATDGQLLDSFLTGRDETAPDPEEPDWLPVLHGELNRLPEKYRLPLVLCDLEGQPRKDVAGQLGIPEGTLSSRLATGREILADRLRHRGVACRAGSLT